MTNDAVRRGEPITNGFGRRPLPPAAGLLFSLPSCNLPYRMVMMLGNIADLLAVQVSLWALYALPPLPAVGRWAGRRNWATLLLFSACAGISLQAVTGALWNRFIDYPPRGALYCTLLFWLAAALATCRGSREPGRNDGIRVAGGSALLAGLLVLALVVRSLHPLRHAFLGQSDAYIHLTFIKDIIGQGCIRHPGYPPGYHWVMAGPSLLWNIDPYLTARYGGAFFGALMTLAAYAFWALDGNERAGMFATFCVAGFPAFLLLVKTGVGAMANQMGLALLPAFLTLYAAHRAAPARRGALPALLAAGLAVSVPLMLLTLLLMAALDLLSMPRKGRPDRPGLPGLPALLVLIPALSITIIHFAQLGGDFFSATARAMTGQAPARPGGAASLLLMAADFLKPKRYGLHSPLMNAAGCILLILFACLLIAAVRRRCRRQRLLALFGLLTGLQTMTGALQFSLYQRAGWNLMLAATLLGGLIADVIYTRISSCRPARTAVAVAVAASILAALLNPPAHINNLSTAEDEMVDLTRALAALEAARTKTALARSFGAPSGEVAAMLPKLNEPPAMVLRTTSDSDDYWEIPDAVLPPGSDLRILYVRRGREPHLWAAPGHCFLFFLDREETIPPESLGAFGMVNPAQARGYSEWQRSLYAPNSNIRRFLADLAPARWEVDWKTISENAELAIVRRIAP